LRGIETVEDGAECHFVELRDLILHERNEREITMAVRPRRAQRELVAERFAAASGMTTQASRRRNGGSDFFLARRKEAYPQ